VSGGGSWRRGVAAFLAMLIASALPAEAAFDETNLRVAARVLGFMERPPSGIVRAGIVYAPDNPRSAADAASLQALLGDGLRVGNVTLQGKLVRINEAAGADVALFLLADDTGGAASRLAEVARAEHKPCITTDLAQVRAGTCAIGVRSQPRVEILVNSAAAAASGVQFSTAFRILITEM